MKHAKEVMQAMKEILKENKAQKQKPQVIFCSDIHSKEGLQIIPDNCETVIIKGDQIDNLKISSLNKKDF